ncbi:hypothetical protein J2S74_003472 [Evansella vedderi]|uniref:Uncharacterized protein n=1 Tax=Evansella vedderi TaxID=38282 RepID=A0ABU0A044_9BACI|nr:hypothetical protein [Evansella vedderi]MDQ0256073.1 hypothetical protein [Evansella vedderi]
MKGNNKKKTYAADNVTLTNTPEDQEITIHTNMSSRNPLKTNQYYPGDAVDEHKGLEEANRDLAQDELRQQNENNSLN